jgi:phenylpropionate dioxygenase-like ring-hydroxylating dioxygenase large terminal subunit
LIPQERYFDADFFQLEAEQLWSCTWQMACRLEEIPQPRDFVEYQILDQSIVVVRTDDMGVTAFQNACRHRGVKVAEGRGTCERGFTCPFHGWCYAPDGKNTAVTQRRTFAEHNLVAEDLDLTPVRCEVWGGCAWINLDDAAPPLRQCLEPAATALDAWKVESLRTEQVRKRRLPVNWKLAEEAFVEMYHVVQTHPQLVIPTRFGRRDDAQFDPAAFIDADIEYLRAMSDGMAGMMPADDVRVAEGYETEPRASRLRRLRPGTEPQRRIVRGTGSGAPPSRTSTSSARAGTQVLRLLPALLLPMYSSDFLPVPPGDRADAMETCR